MKYRGLASRSISSINVYEAYLIQSAMGIEKSQFPELEGMNDEESEEELTDEEIQLRREEKEESGGEWNLNFGTSEKRSELYTEEWSEEDKQLRREEREAEEEKDD